MPPPATKKKLTAAQKETLKRWIAEGAEYQPHWSLIAPTRPALPPVKNSAWVKNPIDAFILAKLEAAGLTPAPEADRRTLARRLSLDLTGLPPEPALVEAFVNDKSAERVREARRSSCWQSPHWGEHRGRYWLDAARYADTHGIHFDNYREIWAYRDWVINAFNQNMPFDQFTIEQLAGDLLPNADARSARSPSGFNRCNITTNEGGIIDEEYQVLYARDRTETFGQIWLGLTAGCAVCHDHKFDPISQQGVLLAVGVLQQHDAGRDGRQHQGHAADSRRADDGGSPAVGRAASRDRRARSGKLDDSQARARRPNSTRWLASVEAGRLADLCAAATGSPCVPR